MSFLQTETQVNKFIRTRIATLVASRQAAGTGALTIAELLANNSLYIDTTAGVLTFELPDMSAYAGPENPIFEFKRIAGGNNAVIDANTTGGTTIDGANTATLAALQGAIRVAYNTGSTEWVQLGDV